MLRTLFSLLLLITFCFTGCKRADQTSDAPASDSNLVELNSIQMKQITMDTVKMKEETTNLVLSGKVSFNMDYSSPVYSFVSGNVIKVNVAQGDYVSKGQVLAVLRSGDISDYEGQYAVALAQEKTAK